MSRNDDTGKEGILHVCFQVAQNDFREKGWKVEKQVRQEEKEESRVRSL